MAEGTDSQHFFKEIRERRNHPKAVKTGFRVIKKATKGHTKGRYFV